MSKSASPPVLHCQKKLKSRLCDQLKENFDEKLHNFQQKSKKIHLNLKTPRKLKVFTATQDEVP